MRGDFVPDRALRARANPNAARLARGEATPKENAPMHFGFGGGGMRFENGMGVFFRDSALRQGAAQNANPSING